MATINGSDGPDPLRGTADADLIRGLEGADSIAGREGDDVIFAGPGNDSVGGDNVPLPDSSPGDDNFGPLPTSFGGNPGDNLIFAGRGDDSVIAGFGADTVLGGPGDDRIVGNGAIAINPVSAQGVIAADGPDLLVGGSGDDSIDGGGGGDLLVGGRGRDTLFGGVGVDTLVGGEGKDLFVFARILGAPLDTGVGPGNRDLVSDFREGVDRLDLSGYRNISPGQPPPVFLDTAPFEASFALQVRYEVKHGSVVVQFVAPFGSPPPDTPPTAPNGPSGEIELVGVRRLTEDDFILS